MRLSTKDLFAIVALCSVVAWCAALAGVDSPGFWIGAGATLFLSVLFVRVASDERSHRYAFLVPIPLLACCALPFASFSLFINAVLLIVAGVFCATRPALGVRRLWFVALSCAAASLIFGAVPAISEVRKLAALRREFPIESIANRLRYERTARRSVPRPPATSPAVNFQLNEWEQTLRRNYRERHFQQIHSREYERFVRASGFGVGRMLRPTPERLRRPPLRNIPFDVVPAEVAESEQEHWAAATWVGTSDDVEHVHKVSRLDFLDPDGFGAVLEPQKRVVGFIEHGFHRSPAAAWENRERWTIVRLELVSLLRFDEPRVYVLDHLPRMDQLSADDIPTRPLDAFESAALDQLWTEEDLVVSVDGHEHRMLGSLRATQQCLECHSAVRGELLGAFSYVLHVGSADGQFAGGE